MSKNKSVIETPENPFKKGGPQPHKRFQRDGEAEEAKLIIGKCRLCLGPIRKGDLTEDLDVGVAHHGCYFEGIGELIEKHPIHTPGLTIRKG